MINAIYSYGNIKKPDVKELISCAANSRRARRKRVGTPGVPQGDCVGTPKDDRRPIEMQMAAVDVISACTCPSASALVSNSIASVLSPLGAARDMRTSGVVTKIPLSGRNQHRRRRRCRRHARISRNFNYVKARARAAILCPRRLDLQDEG